MSDRAKKRAPARKFTTLDDHEALDHARWSYARMKHLAKLVLNGETEEAVKMARALTGKDKATAHAMVKIEQGEMVLRDSGWVLRFLVENMGEALTNSGAENYLTMSFRLGVGRDSYAKDLYSVTLQREGKLTPHEARMLAEKERDAALAEVAKLRAKLAAAAAEIRALLLPTAPALTHAEALDAIRRGPVGPSTCARCNQSRTRWCEGCGYCATTCCACESAESFAPEAPHG